MLREVAAQDPSAPNWQFLQERWTAVKQRAAGQHAPGAAQGEEAGVTDEAASLLLVISHTTAGFPRAQAEELRAPAVRVEQDVAADHPGTVLHDPLPVLCVAEQCYATRDGVVLYQDQTHLSVDGSLLLVPGMREVLADVVD